jgi:putative membrane protein
MTMSPATPEPPARRGVQVPGWVLAVVAGLVVVGGGFAIGWAASDHHRGDRFRRFSDHGGRHPVAVVLFVALVVALIVLVVRHFSTRPRSAGTAEDVLADRFARGEIDEAEYARRRSVLRS